MFKRKPKDVFAMSLEQLDTASWTCKSAIDFNTNRLADILSAQAQHELAIQVNRRETEAFYGVKPTLFI